VEVIWTVVDYKSDREIGADGEGRYRSQVALYAVAIERATTHPALPILMRL
jgi:ATP-dependent exoDNAse (exonuclease V) beta subunit